MWSIRDQPNYLYGVVKMAIIRLSVLQILVGLESLFLTTLSSSKIANVRLDESPSEAAEASSRLPSTSIMIAPRRIAFPIHDEMVPEILKLRRERITNGETVNLMVAQ